MGMRLLIAAGESAASADELPDSVRALINDAEKILVVTPTLPGRFEWLASATDRAREEADERLRIVLGQVAETEASTAGVVGSDDPLMAFADAIREFAPDHLLIGFRERGPGGWQERGLLDQIVERFGLPMTVFTVPAR
jgi:hypothetical protein